MATFYYNQHDFVNAEKNFQDKLLLQSTNFAYRARMMAGRSAFARQAWKQAYDYYFTPLINDNNCPPDIVAEAFFALGDTIIQQDADPAKPLQKFVDALKAFGRITQLYPTNRLAPLAWGRIGDCYLQMGTADDKQYENATNAYQKAMSLAAADVNTRSQAEVGLAHALRFMAQSQTGTNQTIMLQAAFEHYYNVVSEKNLRPGETPDPFWFKEAALNAGRLAEATGRREVAIKIYQRLAAALPQYGPAVEKRIENARRQEAPEKS